MGTVAYGGETRFGGPARPALRTVAAGVILGYLLAYAVAVALALPLLTLGIVSTRDVTHPRPHTLGWPFPGTGAWCVLANAAVTGALLVITALAIRGTVAARTARPVSLTRLLLILAVTGVAPLAVYRGLLPGPLLAFAATVVLVHWAALDASPSPVGAAWTALPRGRRRAVAAVGVAALAALPLSYGVAHPLRMSSALGGTLDRNVLRIFYGPGPHSGRPTHVRYSFMLDNKGFARVTLLSVGVAGDEPPLLVRIGAGVGPWRVPQPVAGVHIGRNETRWVTLVLMVPDCSSSTGYLDLSRALVRYRLLGTTFTQSVPLDVRPTIRCR